MGHIKSLLNWITPFYDCYAAGMGFPLYGPSICRFTGNGLRAHYHTGQALQRIICKLEFGGPSGICSKFRIARENVNVGAMTGLLMNSSSVMKEMNTMRETLSYQSNEAKSFLIVNAFPENNYLHKIVTNCGRILYL